jgi:hypothetical protein
MLAAAMDLSGTQTETPVWVEIWDSDPRVEVVTGKPNPNPMTGYYQER